ncbi:hypothetical protein PG993_011812 [Apiospora rasikravindrae]|uniref:BTB domain transcription factor n=1 Tax=Apiospora rasikravindrae TaxID=990691 RepID=A0ABR1S0P3_9PEZI
MPSTRSSEKNAESTDQGAGAKHEMEEKTSPAPKRTKKVDDEKTQLTIEESMPDADGGAAETKKADDADDNGKVDASEEKNLEDEPKEEKKQEPQQEKEDKQPDDKENEKPAPVADDEQQPKSEENGASAVEPEAREGEVPASILEKGIIYFFFRGRVGIDEPSGVDDIARTYLVLRPMAREGKLGDGPIGDAGNSRLVAIPKKKLPLSGRDKWIAFVEKVDASFATLKGEFLAADDYETKTAGTRHSPTATPIGEGVYAITSTGRESHLAYMLTLPQELGETQKDMGLREKGSFVLSTRNPDYPPPKYAQLPEGPDYPKEVKDDFRSLRWSGTTPKHLDYVNTQVLLIGEGSGIDKAMEPQKQDQKDGKEEPEEELVKLEEEDAQRMKDLSEDDAKAIFADLGASAKDYPKLQTTF